MSGRLSSSSKWIGIALIFGVTAISGLAWIALQTTSIGSRSYSEIISNKDLTADILPPPLYLVEAHLAFEEIKSDPAALAAEGEKIARLHSEYDARIAYWKSQKLSADLSDVLFKRLDPAARAFWRAVEEEALPAVRRGDTAALMVASDKADAAFSAEQSAVLSLIPLLQKEQVRAETHAGSLGVRAKGAILATSALICFACLVSLLLMRARVIGPLTRMTAYMSGLAGGDYSSEPPQAKHDDEVGEMSKAVAVFREAALERQRIRREHEQATEAARESERRVTADREAANAERSRVVAALGEGLAHLAAGTFAHRVEADFPPEFEGLKNDFNAAAATLDDLLGRVHQAAGGVQSGAAEISIAADDLSRRTEQQAASLEETAAALEQITATVRETAGGAAHARQFVTEARTGAQRSGMVVSDAVAAMSRISESSTEIEKIVGVIDEIAFQTNLLALNAGVEAARAGEAGKGFAVVASEVRALAQRSSVAAKEIHGLIADSGVHVQEGVQLVRKAGEALAAIVDQVAHIDELIGAISNASQEQAAGLAQVNIAVGQMDQMTQQNAAMVEEATAAATEMSSSAQGLMQRVSHFKLSSSATARANGVDPRPLRLRVAASR